MLSKPAVIAALLVVQALCATVFVVEILLVVFGVPAGPVPWAVHELIEIGAALGLMLGVVIGAFALRASLRRAQRAEQALKAASGAFMDVVQERFDTWRLTPAERDVALFALKGFSLAEIAGFRNTSEGTVKAQSNAIYRKAGVSGRPQLLSLFVEDLMDQDAPSAPSVGARS